MNDTVRDELEQRLLVERDDEETWAVYADLLQQAGLPPGEVIALAQRELLSANLNDATRFSDLQKNAIFRHREWYWGAAWDIAKGVGLEWKHGFVDSMVLSASHGGEDIRELLSANAAYFLRSLSVPDLSVDVLEALVEEQRPVLELTVRHSFLERDRFNARSWVTATDLARAFPLLRVLDGAGMRLSLDVPMPTLERLGLRDESLTLENLADAFAHDRLPALRELHVPRLDDGALSALVASGVAAQLVRVECPGLGDALARRLLDARDRFSSLQAVRPGRSVAAEVRAGLDGAFKKKRGTPRR